MARTIKYDSSVAQAHYTDDIKQSSVLEIELQIALRGRCRLGALTKPHLVSKRGSRSLNLVKSRPLTQKTIATVKLC